MKILGLGLIIFGILIFAYPNLLNSLIALLFILGGLSIVGASYSRKRWVIRHE